MKTKIFTLLAASTLAFFTACSDDSESKSIAEICADGLSEDCLVGTWTLKSISTKDLSETINAFTGATNGVLEFRDNGIYHYSRSSAGSCPGVDEGEWSIAEDDSLTFFENKLGDCIDFMKKYTVTPKVEVVGETVNLILNEVVFQQDESDGMYAGNDTEVFTRTE